MNEERIAGIEGEIIDSPGYVSERVALELIWLAKQAITTQGDLKPRLEAIDEKIGKLIALHESLAEAQAKINALTTKFGIIASGAEETAALPEP